MKRVGFDLVQVTILYLFSLPEQHTGVLTEKESNTLFHCTLVRKENVVEIVVVIMDSGGALGVLMDAKLNMRQPCCKGSK